MSLPELATLTGLVGSPWFLLLIFTAVAADSVVPMLPAEIVLIAAGVGTASAGGHGFLAVIAVAALGAFVGDHIVYMLARGARGAVCGRAGTRRRIRVVRAADALAERGPALLVAAHFVPGGRTVSSLAAGVGGLPLRSFTLPVALAATAWSIYTVMLGIIGGAVFHGNVVLSTLCGLAIGTALAWTVEIVLRRRRRGGPALIAEHPVTGRVTPVPVGGRPATVAD